MPPDGCDGAVGNAHVANLTREFPIPTGWRGPEVFEEVVAIAEVPVHLVGLCARGPDCREALGSAAGTGEPPRARAYFELLERLSLLDAAATADGSFRVLDTQKREVGMLGHADVFPSAPSDGNFRYSLSNGVAAGSTFESAARAAYRELIERDRVLRSWYGAIRPVRDVTSALGPLEGLAELYSLETYVFPEDREGAMEVAAVFGFPRETGRPFIRGMGAGESRAEAVSRAARECLQNLGFLWGEALPEDEPIVSTTAEYHQEYYLWPGSQSGLRRWLAGEHSNSARVRSPVGIAASPRFADLTPPGLEGRMFVLKALPVGGELPLVFGQGNPLLGSLDSDLEVHPIA